MPIIQVNMIQGRSQEDKARLIQALTDAAETSLNAPRASVRVLIHELPPEHWGVAGVAKSSEKNS